MPTARIQLWLKGVLASVLVLTAGCGSNYPLAPISGRVTVDGEPIAGLRVAFEPIGGSGRPDPGPDSIAVTDAEGRYSLNTTESGHRGAVVGACRVRIWALPANEPDQLAQDKPEPVISDDRDPNYDPIAEIQALRTQRKGPKKPAKKPKKLIPLKYNDKTELTFEVKPEGSDKADFAITWD